uniref:Uncharacterized protein n=1 Tax=viral metagenome TaxID=1070528 RepID=A0A6C0I4G6_9ZZZZ
MPLKIQINLYTLFIWNLEIMSESSSSDPPVVTPDASVNLAFYGTASLIYLFLNFRSPDNNNIVLKILYLLVMLAANFILMWWLMSQQCVNPNLGWVAGGSILMWLILFVPIFWLLENMYVWLEPFGNTFGYLFIKLMGVTTFMDKILKDRTPGGENNRINKYINYIRSDPWGFFSMLTTNADAKPDILQADKAFTELQDKLKPAEYNQENRAQFVSYVRMKESVAKLVFYLLTLNLMTDITAVFLMEKSPCTVDSDDTSDPPNKRPTKPTAEPTVYNSNE